MEVRELSRKIEWRPRKAGIAQVYDDGMEYAFCSPDYKQQLPWIFCKDFLHDAIFSLIHGTELSIYGYTYDPKTDPQPNMRRMRLMVANSSDPDLGSKVEHAIDFVNQVEKDMKIPSMSRVFRCPSPPKRYAKCGVYMFSGSGHWLLAPPMVSLYTLMIRVGFVHTKGVKYTETIEKIIGGKIVAYQDEDSTQLRNAKAGMTRLISEGYRTVFGADFKPNYPPNIDSGTMHNYFGICSFAEEKPKPHCPAWFKKPSKSAV